MSDSKRQRESEIEALESRLADLAKERDEWKAKAEQAQRHLEQEQDHVKALLASLTRAEHAATVTPEESPTQEDPSDFEAYFDPDADPLDQLLGRDKAGESHPTSLSDAVNRIKQLFNLEK